MKLSSKSYYLKSSLSIFFVFFLDITAIILSLYAAYQLRKMLPFFPTQHTIPLTEYLFFAPLYIVVPLLFFYEGLYTKRYDFWHETRIVLRSLFLGFILIMAYLALSKTIQNYSRAIMIFAFLIMAVAIPTFRRLAKYTLHKLNLWQKPAYVYGKNSQIHHEVFQNFYIGYTPAKKESAQTVFIDSRDMDRSNLHETIREHLRGNKEVIFIPLLNEFDLTQSQIFELSNANTNLIALQNRLKSPIRRTIKTIVDFIVSAFLLIPLLPIMGWIAYRIKKEEPNGSIIFKQKRLGQSGNTFVCYKFRTMIEDNEEVLYEYLKKNPEEKAYYSTYHKYKNDPRITKTGAFLRRTSLDELPQIFNVLKGEMSLVGPRPYLIEEKEKMKDKYTTITSVRPGITGLWQVSGRSDIDFQTRLEIDEWYIRNWSLWLDVVILLKTVKTVLFKEGAY